MSVLSKFNVVQASLWCPVGYYDPLNINVELSGGRPFVSKRTFIAYIGKYLPLPLSFSPQVPPMRGGGGVHTEVKGIVCYRLQSEGNQFSSICRLRPRHPPPPKIVWVTKSVASYRSTLDTDRTWPPAVFPLVHVTWPRRTTSLLKSLVCCQVSRTFHAPLISYQTLPSPPNIHFPTATAAPSYLLTRMREIQKCRLHR